MLFINSEFFALVVMLMIISKLKGRQKVKLLICFSRIKFLGHGGFI